MVSDIPTLQQNIRYLNQAAQLVDSLPDAVYRFSDHPIFMSGVGKHLRHILDYYSAFLAGFGRHIDYEARQRDIRTETDRREAAGRISNTIKALIKTVPEASVLNRRVWVSGNMGERKGEVTPVASTVGRELAFLASHTVHHFAMIAMILNLQNTHPPADFGVAPSTLTHLSKTIVSFSA
jgi:uncharacterized damage-inducible protein DinB